uniref:hypothetical protein n=1 Tax=Cronobacter turicensis TaxID=413502 RepID=UPI001F385B87
PNGWMYDKHQEGIIPKEIAKVFFQRKDWKKKMFAEEMNAEAIKKIIMKGAGSCQLNQKLNDMLSSVMIS